MTTSSLFRIGPMALIFVAVCLAGVATAEDTATGSAKLDPPVKPRVTGKFLGNGKEAALRFVTVLEREGFDGKQAVRVIFTEKDPGSEKDPEFDAFFGKFGSALILSVHYDGEIFGCEVAHSAHKKSGFSSVGRIRMEEFKVAGGNVSGHVTTDGAIDSFGDKWDVDLKFAAPLPEKLRTASVASSKPAANAPSPIPDRAPAEAAAAPVISARSLPLPADARDVQYKAMVHQIQLTSGQSVAAVTSELSAALNQQGWKEGPGSMKGAKNAILKRNLGNASLTIMIQPAPAGSSVKIFADGVDWEDAAAGVSPASDKPAGDDVDVDEIEKQADKMLQDALKGLPEGF